MKQIKSKLIIGQVSAIILYTVLYWATKGLNQTDWLELLLLLLGLSLGIGLVWLDEYWLVNLYSEADSQAHPLSQSLVVLLSLFPIGVFVVTSTASVLSMGFFLGLAASIVTKMVSLYQQPDVLRQQFFWQLKTPLGDSQVQWVVNGAVILLGFFSILFVW